MRTTNLIIGAAAVVVLGGAGGAYFLLSQPEAQPNAPALAEAAMRPSLSTAPTADQPSAERELASEDTTAKLPAVRGTADAEVLAGTADAERIYAATDDDPQGVDTIDAGDGDDRIYADAGDIVQGGAGHDELIVRGSTGFALKLAGSGIEDTWGGDGDDDFDGVDAPDALKLRGGGGNDRLRGGRANDVLYGGDGDDRIDGGPGDDNLKGEAGTDTLTGGSGADYFNYPKFDGSTDIVTDYSAKDGDTVTAASFRVSGKDTQLLDEGGNVLFVLEDYDAGVLGVARRK